MSTRIDRRGFDPATRQASARRAGRFRPTIDRLEDRRLLSASIPGADPTFGVGGVAEIPLPGTPTPIQAGSPVPEAAVAVQADGAVAVAGTEKNAAGNTDFVVDRLTAAGVLDPTFGNGGVVTIGFDLGGDDNDTARVVTIGPDGKILVAGTADNATGSVIALARLNPDGTPDPTFGVAGKARLAFTGDTNQSPFALSVAADGRITVAATGTGQVDLLAQYLANTDMARLNADGSPDATFGSGGTVINSFVSSGSPDQDGLSFVAATIGPDGKFVFVENLRPAGDFFQPTRSYLLRYNADGSVDPTLGFAGMVEVRVGPAPPPYQATEYDVIGAVAVGPDGKIYVAGPTTGFNGGGQGTAFDVGRLNPDGSSDPSYGANGTGSVAVASGQVTSVTGLGLIPVGRVVVSGQAIDSNAPISTSFAVGYLFSDGTPDIGFGAPGQLGSAQFALLGPGQAAGATALAVQGDGRVVVAGTAQSADNTRAEIAAVRFAASPPASLMADEKFVQALYRTFLRRQGSLAEVDFHAAELATIGRAGVAAEISRSTEALTIVVNGLYQSYLGRAADPAGLAGYIAQIQAGATVEEVGARLNSSEEFYNDAPVMGNTDESYIRSLYQKILGRPASNTEVDAYVALLPKLGRLGVARSFFASVEYRAAAIRADYLNVLGRTPSDAEVNSYATSPIPIDAIPIIFASSAEYYARA